MTDVRGALEEEGAARARATWMGSAACRGMELKLFFPRRGEAMSHEARAACTRCPVARECLDYALENNCVVGIYGGLPARARRGMVRRHRAESA